jgi:hypothetical protein
MTATPVIGPALAHLRHARATIERSSDTVTILSAKMSAGYAAAQASLHSG